MDLEKSTTYEQDPFDNLAEWDGITLGTRVREEYVRFSAHGYLEALRPAEGSFDWQQLFTRAPLDDEEFTRTTRHRQLMLEDLPTLFPGHDYAPLYARFAERVR